MFFNACLTVTTMIEFFKLPNIIRNIFDDMYIYIQYNIYVYGFKFWDRKILFSS